MQINLEKDVCSWVNIFSGTRYVAQGQTYPFWPKSPEMGSFKLETTNFTLIRGKNSKSLHFAPPPPEKSTLRQKLAIALCICVKYM